jgi:heme/copper-type cytochrome/quinol oxidase subunit 1
MPRPSVWFIRTALCYLGAGFTLGALILFQKGIPYSDSVWRLLPMHIEFLLIGWTTQFAMGVAFWILPRFLHGAARGDERLVWLAYGLLNLGVLSVGAGAWLAAPGAALVAGRSAEMLAVGLFAIQAVPRAKAQGR